MTTTETTTEATTERTPPEASRADDAPEQAQATALAIDLAMLADKRVDGYGQRAADRALRAQIQQAHNDKESWT